MNCERCGHPHAQADWDELWTDWRLFFQNKKGFNHKKAMAAAHKEMEKHGPRPKGPPKPPLWLRVGAGLKGEGTNMMKVWNWLNGRKTVIAAILVAIPVIWEGVAQILGAGGMGPEQVAAISGIVLGVVGVAHKILKSLGLAAKPQGASK